MTPSRTSRTALAALGATALVAAGIGVGAVALGSSGTTTRTIVRAAPAAAVPVANTTDTSLSVAEIYRRTSAGVVEITATGPRSSDGSFPFGQQSGTQEAEGSGFVFDAKGDIVTNAHVVEGATSLSVSFSDGTVYKAKLVGSDPATDLAVIRVDARAGFLEPLRLGNSDSLQVGDGVVAIGSPFGLPQTVTSGIVSALHREITSPSNDPIEDAIQTDASINKGNSGGPLLDLSGDVIGVNSQIDSQSGGSDGVGFAVPANTVKSVAAQLIASGKAEHGLLGVEVQTIPAQVAAQLKQPAGVGIAQVRAGSAAAHAGLQAARGTTRVNGRSYPSGGDVIVAVDGAGISTAEELRARIDAHRPGDRIALTVRRGKTTRTVQATLGQRASS